MLKGCVLLMRKYLLYGFFLFILSIFFSSLFTNVFAIESNNEEIKISVIIPVYNVENYLGECVDSVVGQSYKNLEIICINDGSTDSSLEILKGYQSRDS